MVCVIGYLKRVFVYTILLTIIITPVSGCSVSMASRQPISKNIELFKVGTSREALVTEFGQPIISEESDGKKVEIFFFVQGYGKITKTGRVIFHGAADFFTFGLWELVGTPIEAYFNGEEMAYHVSYDDNNHLNEVNAIHIK